MSPIAPLAGYTVAIASDRRRHELADLLESVGARTVGIQAARSVAKPDEAIVREATRRCVAAPCQEVVISSAVGLRAWLAVARRWGLEHQLAAVLTTARLLARDAAAADALRALGLSAIFSTERETTPELLRYLAAQPLARRRVAVQTHQLWLADGCAELRQRGADVIEVPTFTPSPPAERYSLHRLLDLIVRRQVDAVAVLGAQVATQLIDHARSERRLVDLTTALRYHLLCVALGAPTAQPLRDQGLPVPVAARPYVEELAETVLGALPAHGLTVHVAGHRLELRGQAVVLDGRFIAVPGGPLAVLRALARHPGEVLSAAEIRGTEPTWADADVDDHAVEMAVSRLRRLFRGTELIETIVKRGYRLAI